jgi:hypothetical protein
MAGLQPPLQPQIFDVFIHVFYAAASNPSGSHDRTIQLWVWVPRECPESSEAFWKPVAVGFMCPGPGSLTGWHLMVTDQGEPSWVTGSTRYRRYKTTNLPSAAPHELSGDYHVNKTATLEGMSTLSCRTNIAKGIQKADYRGLCLQDRTIRCLKYV